MWELFFPPTTWALGIELRRSSGHAELLPWLLSTVCVCVGARAEANDQHQVACSVVPISLLAVSHWIWSSLTWLGWTVAELPGSAQLFPRPPVLWLQSCTTCSLDGSSGEPDSGPRAYVAGVLLNILAP